MPAGGLPAAITTGESLMTSVTDSIATWCGLDELVTVSVKKKVPGCSGVPDSRPSGLSDIPGGRAPLSVQVNGPPRPPLGGTNMKVGYRTPVEPVGGGIEFGVKLSRAERESPPPQATSSAARTDPSHPFAMLRPIAARAALNSKIPRLSLLELPGFLRRIVLTKRDGTWSGSEADAR